MQLGTGSYTFDWVNDWAKIPDGVTYGCTHGVVTDKDDNVLIYNQSENAVLRFDREGNYLGAWGKQYAAGAHGMLLHVEGGTEYLYLVDYELQETHKTTLDGEVIWKIGIPDRKDIYPTAENFKPTDVAVAPNGDVYVTDGYGASYVHHYDADQKYVASYGTPGDGVGELACPHGISVDTRGPEAVLYIADRGNNRIQVFSLTGEPMRIETDEMRMPCSFFQFGDDIYVPDLQSRVSIYGKDDKLITHLGDAPGRWDVEGWPDIPMELRVAGKFSSPHGVCVDSAGDVYCVEWCPQGRISKMKRA